MYVNTAWWFLFGVHFFFFCGWNIFCSVVSLVFSLSLKWAFSFTNLSDDCNSLLSLCLLYTLAVGITSRFLFKSWNVPFVNVFVLRFITCPIGSEWCLAVFSTVLQFFLMLLWFALCSLSCLLFPYFGVGLRCCWRPPLRFLNVLIVALVL